MPSEISSLFNPQTEQKFRFWMSWLCLAIFINLLISCYNFAVNFKLDIRRATIVDLVSYSSFISYIALQALLVFFGWQTLQKQQSYINQQDEDSLLQFLESKYALLCLFAGDLVLELVNHIFWRFFVSFIS